MGMQYYNNTNTNTQDDIYSAIIYGASHMRTFTLGHLGESRSAPGGRKLVGQAANLTSESACMLHIHPSPLILSAYSTIKLILIVPRMVEG